MNDHEGHLNPATIWAETAVAALADAGLREICVAPGSRSTALTLAFAAHPDVRVYRHLDERSAGFFALGMALALDRPVALLCTSGTAAVNFMPAIVEARMAQVPLLALTADRPPELRYSGANQTIDQIRLYGEQVLWSVDVPLPEAAPSDVVLRNLRALMARALARANGAPKGPVHLNFPFRKPFEPLQEAEWPGEDVSERRERRTARIVSGAMAPPEEALAELADLIATHERGLIVCGPRCPRGNFPAAVAALAQRSAYPLLADPLSGVRYGPWIRNAVVSGGYEGILAQQSQAWEAPTLVLRFGAVPTSRWLNDYLLQSAPRHVVHVRSNGVWADDGHRTTLFVQADETLLCGELLRRLPERVESSWLETIKQTEVRYWRTIAQARDGHFFDGLLIPYLIALLPENALLFVGNSLPVRHVDEYGAPRTAPLQVFGNRGASGIDGNISTALGIAAARREPVTLMVGDVTFYHDMNGLLAAREHNLDVTVVLMNNGGGGIFRRLPVAAIEPPFTELFLTPHGLDFAHAAALYGFEYVRVEEPGAFCRHFTNSVVRPGRRIIEVRTDGDSDMARRRALMEAVHEALAPGRAS